MRRDFVAVFNLAVQFAGCVVVGDGKATRFIDDMENKQYGVLNPLSAAY